MHVREVFMTRRGGRLSNTATIWFCLLVTTGNCGYWQWVMVSGCLLFGRMAGSNEGSELQAYQLVVRVMA